MPGLSETWTSAACTSFRIASDPSDFAPQALIPCFTPDRSHVGKYALAKLCLTGRSSAAHLTQNQSGKGREELNNLRGGTYCTRLPCTAVLSKWTRGVDKKADRSSAEFPPSAHAIIGTERMDLIHLCPKAVRQEREQEFPRPVGSPLTLVSCTYVTFHCLSEDFNVLLRAGKFLP